MSTETKVKKQFVKPAISAGVSAIGLRQLLGNVEFNVGEMKIPILYAGAAIGAGSSFATELISNFIIPHLSSEPKLQHIEGIATHLGGAALSHAMLPYLLNSDMTNDQLRNLMLVGMGSELISEYLYDNFFTDSPAGAALLF